MNEKSLFDKLMTAVDTPNQPSVLQFEVPVTWQHTEPALPTIIATAYQRLGDYPYTELQFSSPFIAELNDKDRGRVLETIQHLHVDNLYHYLPSP